jgi:hypothetical protein
LTGKVCSFDLASKLSPLFLLVGEKPPSRIPHECYSREFPRDFHDLLPERLVKEHVADQENVVGGVQDGGGKAVREKGVSMAQKKEGLFCLHFFRGRLHVRIPIRFPIRFAAHTISHTIRIGAYFILDTI